MLATTFDLIDKGLRGQLPVLLAQWRAQGHSQRAIAAALGPRGRGP